MKKFYLLSLIFLLLISGVSAYSDLGVFEVNENFELLQTCDTCSFVTLDTVIFPNGSTQFINTSMTKLGYTYNYSFNTSQIGSYKYVVCGDKNGGFMCETIVFTVNVDGVENSNNWFMFSLLVALIFVSWLLIKISENLDSEHVFLKILFTIIALVMGVSSVVISYTTIINSGLSVGIGKNAFTIYKLVMWSFRLFAFYLIGYLSYKGLKWLKEAVVR